MILVGGLSWAACTLSLSFRVLFAAHEPLKLECPQTWPKQWHHLQDQSTSSVTRRSEAGGKRHIWNESVSFFWVELQKQNPSWVCPIFLQMLSQCFYFIPSFLPHFYADPSSFNRNRLSWLSVVSPHRPQAWSQAVNGPVGSAASRRLNPRRLQAGGAAAGNTTWSPELNFDLHRSPFWACVWEWSCAPTHGAPTLTYSQRAFFHVFSSFGKSFFNKV